MTSSMPSSQLLDAAGVELAIERLSDTLVLGLKGVSPIFLAGIPTRGVVLAKRLQSSLAVRGVTCDCGAVDIAMYRDDLGLREEVVVVRDTKLPINLESWTVVLVDDVHQTGRTARAAIEAVLGFGRPRRIFYAVLVDRGGRELPIRPDFTATELSVGANSQMRVRLIEVDGEEGIFEE